MDPFEFDANRPEDTRTELVEARVAYRLAQERLHRAAVKAAAHPELRDLLTLGSYLTPREVTVICAMSNGATNAEIGAQLFVGINTVKTNIRTAFRRMGVDTRIAAVRWAIQIGLDAPELVENVSSRSRPVELSPVARQDDAAVERKTGAGPALARVNPPPPSPLGLEGKMA